MEQRLARKRPKQKDKFKRQHENYRETTMGQDNIRELCEIADITEWTMVRGEDGFEINTCREWVITDKQNIVKDSNTARRKTLGRPKNRARKSVGNNDI